jgi:hypothetical protein
MEFNFQSSAFFLRSGRLRHAESDPPMLRFGLRFQSPASQPTGILSFAADTLDTILTFCMMPAWGALPAA